MEIWYIEDKIRQLFRNIEKPVSGISGEKDCPGDTDKSSAGDYLKATGGICVKAILNKSENHFRTRDPY